MARPRKDKFTEISIEAENNTQQEIIYVSIPFFIKITYEIKLSKDNNKKPTYGTTDIILKRSIYDKTKIIKEFREKNLKVIKIEQLTIPFPDTCEKCYKKGTPIIEVKPNDFHYHYTIKSDSTKNKSNKPDEYWLIYEHGKGKKCRIAQFDMNNFLFKPTKNRINELHKHFYPMNLGKGVHLVNLLSK